MRLQALTILALTSRLCVAAVWPRYPQAPPYPISRNGSTWGLTGTPSSIPSTSSSSSSPYSTIDHTSSSSSLYSTTETSPTSTSSYVSTSYSLSGSLRKPTSYTPSSISVYSATGYPTSNPDGNSTTQVPSRCSGQTLNVLSASLDWWYTRTLYNVVSTISIQYNGNHSSTGWTVLPATTPFDLTSAMASATCESTLTFNTYLNISLYEVNCTPAPTPVAASTTVITQTAYTQLNASTGNGRLPDVVKTPPPATITVPSSAGAYGEGTAFVFFSSYEIVTKSLTNYGNGTAGCAAVTQTYAMDEPFSFEYDDGDVNGTQVVGAGVTGDVNPAFLGVVSQTKAVAGSWVAAPTVAVVVQDIYAAEIVLAAAQGPLLRTETILQTPEPTLPSGFTTDPAQTGLPTVENTGNVESTAASLDVPTHINTGARTTGPTNNSPTQPGGSPTSRAGGNNSPTNTPGGNNSPTNTPGGNNSPTNTPGGNNSPTNTPGGNNSPTNTPGGNNSPTNTPGGNNSPTNTPGGNNSPTSGGGNTSPNNGPGPTATSATVPVDNIISAVLGAVTPTNALEVLQQAENSLTHSNPTASAIIHGLDNGASQTATSTADQNFSIGTGLDGKPTLVVGGTTITANSNTEFDVGTATLTPGGQITDGSTTVSLASDFSAVVVNGETHAVSTAVITPASVLTIDGQSLTRGGVITVAGTTISFGQDGSSIVVNGVTQNIGSATVTATALAASITAPPVLTIGSEAFTAINKGYTYVISGKTLTPGQLETVTVAGSTYIVSLASGATVLEIETVGPNGDPTATAYETLFSGAGPQPTVTNTVNVLGASSGTAPSAGPLQSVQPSLQDAASSIEIRLSAICISLTTFVLAIWL